MNILLTNDDGIYADGLWALYRRLNGAHTVNVVAPDRERSAVGHGITLQAPLRAGWIGVNGFHGHAVTGTPADCIKLAIQQLLPERPDLVISGINPGANVGVSINYSGTVAGAREAALYGIPAIAVSLAGQASENLEDAATFVAHLVAALPKLELPFGTFLNVNLPDIPLKAAAGICICRQEVTEIKEKFEKRHDPRKRVYYWSGHELTDEPQDMAGDRALLKNQKITITPVKCDMTDYDLLARIDTIIGGSCKAGDF